MRIIIPATSLVEEVVGKQKCTADQDYRLMTYVLQCPVDDGVLFYHMLTCCLLFLTSDEVAHITEQKELIDSWFLVPQQFDDKKFCWQVKQTAQLFQPSAKIFDGYTVLTTTGCNARCFYCYEKGTKPVDMTTETAERVGRFIMSHRGNEKVTISWFGGEPLFNGGVIDQICTDLSNNGVPFRSRMTSNGYLFDAEMVKRAKDLWQLYQVQITIDGTEQTYNRIKHYIYGSVNAFERVLRNIELLMNAGIRVLVRLNVDKHNIGEMSQLVELLHQRFGINENLSVYSHELYGLCNPEDSEYLYAQRMLLEQKIVECGYRPRLTLQKEIKLNNCMADNDRSVVISPEGHLGKCEHYIDREFFGHIDSEEKDKRIICKFKEHPAEMEVCTMCAYYPQCIRLTMCANGTVCTPETQQERLHNTIEAMKDEYQDFLKKQKHDIEL